MRGSDRHSCEGHPGDAHSRHRHPRTAEQSNHPAATQENQTLAALPPAPPPLRDRQREEHAHTVAHLFSRLPERRRLVATLAITATILVLEAVGGLLSRSLALLGDAGHMLADVSAQLLSLLALLFALRPADSRRTYGYFRLEILAALINGVVLVTLSLLLALESYHRLRAPVEIRTGLMLAVAAVGLAGNLAGIFLLRHARSLNVRGAYLHILSDTLSSVAVLAGGLAMHLSGGLRLLDPLLGFAVAAFICHSAVRLLREAVDVLLEAVPREICFDDVCQQMLRVEGVVDVHDVHIWTITSGLYALSAHIVIDPAHAGQSDQILGRLKQALVSEHHIAHSTIQTESPDYEHVGEVH